jgi:cytosine/adenosine deaminase-related metal-dependent hydrolase
MTHFRADWIVPVANPPIRGGFVTVEAGRIVDVGPHPAGLLREPRPSTDREPRPAGIDLERVAILPALVNAHTHLELSYLHRRIPPSPRFGDWVRTVMSMRKAYPDPSDPHIVEAARQGIERARASGTGLFGDVSNTLVTVPLLQSAGLPARVFHELTGFTEQDPRGRVADARSRANAAAMPLVRVSVAPHAPYSVSAELFKAIREDLDAHDGAVSSVHLGESPEEEELLRQGSGDIRRVLEELGRWPAGWQAPGVSPVEYLSDLGFLDARVLVVHGVQFDGDALARLSAFGATLVSCPRSNVHVGVGSPPLEAIYAMDVDVAFGTDSLASVETLSLFDELAEARRIAPRVPARRLIESATLIGAQALGFGDDYGSIEAGKRAALIGVRVPTGIDDVEEFLVSGVAADAVSWVSSIADV